jgi:pyridine nucleotide-disulfide oxidoreductase family protein
MTKRLVLLGGGHAHLHVLAALARHPLPGTEVIMVTPQPSQVYSGMLPGWVAGHYTLAQISIDLQELARSAGATLVLDAATGLAPDDRILETRDGRRIGFDVLSIDVGSAPPSSIPGAMEHGVGVRPIESFVAAWEQMERRLHETCEPFHAVVLGAGPGGVELAFALRHRAMKEGWSHLHVHLVGSGSEPLPQAPSSARCRVMETLRQQCIRWQGCGRGTEVEADRILLESGQAIPADSCWVVTGSAAPAWLAASGLAVDPQGYARVRETLQSVSHAHVFVAGDAASHPQPLPKSGVYAVRSGAILGRNLLAFCAGKPLTAWQPQSRALYLISTGDRRAIATWGSWSAQGRWVWRWKDWIDRRFIRSWVAGRGG